MTNSTLVSPVKMEYWWNFSIFGLKMMMQSGLGNIFWNSSMLSPCHIYYWILIKSTNSVIRKNMVSAWRNFKNIFPRTLFMLTFRPEMLKFHQYSILTGDTRVEFVIFSVLIFRTTLLLILFDINLIFCSWENHMVQDIIQNSLEQKCSCSAIFLMFVI